MKDQPLVIVTTRARSEALIRFLSTGYLGHVKDDGYVRELLKDAEQALAQKS